MNPKRIYVRARLLSFSSLDLAISGGTTPTKLVDSESCGFMVAYPSRGKFERAHPGENPIVFEITSPSTIEKGIGACPVCSRAFKLNSAGRMPSHGPHGNRCDGTRKEPKIDGPRVKPKGKEPETSYDRAMQAQAIRTMAGPPPPPMTGGPITGEI